MTLQQQPDIEIYVKHATKEMIEAWFKEVFDNFEADSLAALSLSTPKASTLSVEYQGKPIEVFLNPYGAGKSYCSIWFKSADTPWNTDLECAESFLALFDTEVRCSSSTWIEAEEQGSDKWWVLTRTERELVAWL